MGILGHYTKQIHRNIYHSFVQLTSAGCSDSSPLNCRVETLTVLLLFPFSQNKGASIKCSVSLVPDMTGDLFWFKAITLPARRHADVSARAMETAATPATPMHSRSNGGHSLVLRASLIFIPGNLYVSPPWAFVVAPAVLFR